MVLARAVEDVEADGMVSVLGSKKDHFAFPGAGNLVVQEVVHELAVRIHDRYARAGVDVPRDHVAEQGALAGAGRAENRQVLAARPGRDCENRLFVAVPVFPP